MVLYRILFSIYKDILNMKLNSMDEIKSNIIFKSRSILNRSREFDNIDLDAMRYALSNINMSQVTCRVECATFTTITLLLTKYIPHDEGIILNKSRITGETILKYNKVSSSDLVAFISDILYYINKRKVTYVQ